MIDKTAFSAFFSINFLHEDPSNRIDASKARGNVLFIAIGFTSKIVNIPVFFKQIGQKITDIEGFSCGFGAEFLAGITSSVLMDVGSQPFK